MSSVGTLDPGAGHRGGHRDQPICGGAQEPGANRYGAADVAKQLTVESNMTVLHVTSSFFFVCCELNVLRYFGEALNAIYV